MSDDEENLTKRYDPARNFRWVFQNSGCESFRLKAIACRLSEHFGLVMTVQLRALKNTDLSELPLDGTHAILKLLDSEGEVTEEYDIVWLEARLIPFLELSYNPEGEDNIIQGVELRHVTVRRR